MSTPPTNDVRQERPPVTEFDTDSELRAVTFTADGQHLVCGGTDGVHVWRVQDGEQVTSMLDVEHVRTVAVSTDGRWIAAGTWKEVVVWDATTYARTFTHEESMAYFNGVDFAPDASSDPRLLTASLSRKASVWDVAASRRVLGPLTHPDIVIAARYAPDGARFATATPKSIRVYDGRDGRVLVDVSLTGQVPPWYNTCLAWSRKRLFVVSDTTIKHLDASTGSEVVEWRVPNSNESSGIVLPQHGESVAYATHRSVTVWNTSTHAQLASPIEHPQDIRSIAYSPDDQFLAVAGEHGKVVIHDLAFVNDLIPLHLLHPTFQELDLQIEDVALDAWGRDDIDKVEALLTATIFTSGAPSHHTLASRALVRARLGDWDAALRDAEQSIKIKPSVTGYIGKSTALVGKGEKDDGYRVCDIALERFHSTHVTTVLLIKAIITFIAGDHVRAISRVDDLIDSVHFNSICHVVQAYMYFLLGSSHMDRRDYDCAIEYFERARTQVRYHKSQTLFVISLIFGWKFDDLGVTIQRQLCEAFFTAGRTQEAGESLLAAFGTVAETTYMSEPTATWAATFAERCLSAPDDAASRPSSLTPLLKQWAKLRLSGSTWVDALGAAVGFTAPKSEIYRAICERLETLDKVTDATECFDNMMYTLGWKRNPPSERAQWIHDFVQRVSKKLEHRGDAAAGALRYHEAISEYSAALSLDPTSPLNLLVKRSKTYVAEGSSEDALQDANGVIRLDPSSPWGYERKHAALHKAGRYEDAIGAFEAMLSKIADSPDPTIYERHRDYVSPAMTKDAIRKVIQEAIRDAPRVLINTSTGHLLDKAKQASSFEELLVFKEMISSMTTKIDEARIEQEVAQYYRYATFSHRWELNEPLYDKVIHIIVYDLDESLTHAKLKTFCKIVRDAGFNWAWSDTCCIDKSDHFVLQEALVSMFKWYEGSAVTIVYLRDVRSPARPGDLVRSIWNKRAWTFQEYHASKVVRFYTQDWMPYMNIEINNHKDSREIISEMEKATGVSAETLRALHPGPEDIREKLCLASKRETTLVEDAAYSLLGVFSISFPIVYGEGDHALGRLLAQLVTNSGDVSILAWTGKSGTFNSCLPANIVVFSELATTHVPKAIGHVEMDAITSKLRASSLKFTQARELYDKLTDLALPMFVGKRIKLPCITFKLGPLSRSWSASSSEYIFRAKTTGLGVVEIKTKEDLTRFDSLYLVHPWIDFLLHRHPVGSLVASVDFTREPSSDDLRSTISEFAPSPGPVNAASASKRMRMLLPVPSRFFHSRSSSHPRDVRSLLPPSTVSEVDKQTHVLHFVARLHQPFGALLFTPTRQNVLEYRRVAAESRIEVRVREDAPLGVLTENARTLDVL